MKKLLLLTSILLLLLRIQSAFASWTIDGNVYTKRKKISIQYANVDTSLSDFPLYIDVTSDGEIGAVCQDDGDDLRFTASDGSTLLYQEQEEFSVTVGDANGDIWVKVSSVSSSGVTEIYVYYGNVGASAQSDPESVWDSSFVFVYHMKDDTTSTILDSTSNSHDIAKASATNPNESVGGIIGNCQNFDDGSDYGSITGNFGGLKYFDIMVWVNSDTAPAAIERYITFGNEKMALRHIGAAARYRLHGYARDSGDNFDHTYWSDKITTGSWQCFRYFWQATDGNHILYVNDSVTGATFESTITSTSVNASLSSGGEPFDGEMDEVRISAHATLTARSVGWRKFVYYNITEDDNELTWGDEETSPVVGFGQVISVNFF